ncbi:MAG: dipeptidase [Rhodothermales bacterium]
MKRLWLILPAILLIGLGYFFTLAPRQFDRRANVFEHAPPYAVREDAQRLHERLLVADLHADLLLWGRNPLKRADYGHVDVPRLIEGNVALQVFSAVTKSPWGQNYRQNEGDSDRITLLVMAQWWPFRTWTSLKERALYQAERLRRTAARSEGRLVMIRTSGDLERYLARRAQEPHLVAGLMAMEGLHPLEGRLENLDAFFDAGYRMLGLTHFFDNEVAGSAHGMEKGGLTDLGRQVVRRMEEQGLLVDLAHASPRTIDDVLDVATRPVVVSHTGVQGTCEGLRNLSDRHLRRIAEAGGVIGIGYWRGAVCDVEPRAVVRAIRYVADLVGVEHVALGSDFDGTVHTYFDTTGLALLTEALLDDGFTEAEIRGIMGGNVLRLLKETLPPDDPT